MPVRRVEDLSKAGRVPGMWRQVSSSFSSGERREIRVAVTSSACSLLCKATPLSFHLDPCAQLGNSSWPAPTLVPSAASQGQHLSHPHAPGLSDRWQVTQGPGPASPWRLSSASSSFLWSDPVISHSAAAEVTILSPLVDQEPGSGWPDQAWPELVSYAAPNVCSALNSFSPQTGCDIYNIKYIFGLHPYFWPEFLQSLEFPVLRWIKVTLLH